MNEASCIYRLEDIVHGYGGRPVLRIDSLKVRKGAIVGLIGPNGSGKSTLLKLLAFVEKPAWGKVYYRDKPEMPFSENVRFQVTLLSQEPYLMRRSVRDNIAYGLKVRRESKQVGRRVDDALSMVGLKPEKFSSRMFNELSGGEVQRVALAARLVLKPSVLLLDEPTASVDSASGQFIREAVQKAQEKWGTTLIVASHDLHWLYSVCDETVHLFDGKVFGEGLETFFFGPWRPGDNGNWQKETVDGQRIKIPKPGSADATFLLKQQNLVIGLEKIDSYDNVLSGSVSRLVLQRKTSRIIATVVAGDMPFTTKFSAQEISKMGLYPGKEVFVHFNAADLQPM